MARPQRRKGREVTRRNYRRKRVRFPIGKLFVLKKKEEIKFLNIHAGLTFTKFVIFTDKIFIMKLPNFNSTHFNSSYILISCLIVFCWFEPAISFAQYAEPPVPISITANWTLEKNQAGSLFGSSVSGAGDVNGDGYEDVIIGAPYYDNGQTDEGVAFLYLGSAVGLSATASWMGQSNQISAYFGRSVSSAGDVNNDGYDDVIIGANYFDNGQTDEGKAFVYMGSATGLGATPAWTFESDEAGAFFACDVSGAGDVNGDGYADVIVGANKKDYWGDNGVGAVYVFFGSATGLSPTISWSWSEDEGESNYGNSVSSAGDVNGDGFDDIIVGAASWGWDGQGCAFVYPGSATGPLDTEIWSDCGVYDAAYFGNSVAGAGDLNSDGYDDIIVGAPNETADYCGRVAVYYGSATGLTMPSVAPDWAVENQCGSFGYSIASGDVNGDGYGDIIVGAPSYSSGQTGEGAIFIYTGGPGGMPGTTTWATQSNQIGAGMGVVGTAADVNGDGFDDIIAGAPYFDNGQIDEGQTRVYLGASGCVDPPDVTLNFTGLVCRLDPVMTLTAGSPAGGTYTGTGIIGTNQFDPELAGVGTHTITYLYVAPGGCSATATDEITVYENPAAATTLGSASLNLCVSSPVVLVANTGTDITYQWYKNNVPIPGAIYLAYLAYTTGNYQVQVTNASGCSKMSSKKKVTHSGCKEGEEINNNELVIYPNPNNGVFNFEYANDKLLNDKVSVEIFDMQGRIVLNEIFIANNGVVNGTINSDLIAGVYFLKINHGETVKTHTLIIN